MDGGSEQQRAEPLVSEGAATCVDGVVSRAADTFTCPGRCRAGGPADVPRDAAGLIPIVAYCEPDVPDWRAPCAAPADATGTGFVEDAACSGGVCVYATHPQCGFVGCSLRCRNDLECPGPGGCNALGVCEPGDPDSDVIEVPDDTVCRPVPGVDCCPIAAAPSCDCFATGGSEACHAVCDAAPVGWTRGVDENGCPVWTGGGGASCGF